MKYEFEVTKNQIEIHLELFWRYSRIVGVLLFGIILRHTYHAAMPLSRAPTRGRYSRIVGVTIFYEDLYRSNCITTYVIPFVIGMLLARDLIVGILIPSSISLPASLFTRSVIQDPVTYT